MFDSLKNDKMMEVLKKKVKGRASDWATDDKPFEGYLSPQDYAEFGFFEGYLTAIHDLSHALENLKGQG
ncbi:MAG: hypothetical protein DRH32_08760 [Deltaproteobacteria bacterium]|nr:MAG: hypothetical protein DRH93_08405 [Deltaproteobacteria bacterium]RLC28604.1 MAG: hypothetical protein DRH32_08760 [Deltaproteobacteria bacterium]